MSFAICFNLDQSKILLSRNGLKVNYPEEDSKRKLCKNKKKAGNQHFPLSL